ncbi:MAG TPA: TIGR02587 family membrane protein [Gemmatimonadales bacterium]|nr:TIGR02587 family membrane protein [Gemmatimonadales bacterium]
MRGLARACAGALIFSLPLFMTMEMWVLGHAMSPFRLALLVALALPMLVGLSHLVGFEPTVELVQDGVDALVALAAAFLISIMVLLLLHVLGAGTSLREATGSVGLLAVAGAVGALLAQSQLHASPEQERREQQKRDRRIKASYPSQLLSMLVGALFLSINVAPTDEVVLLAARMSPWHSIGLVLVSLAIMHGFVYSLEFKGHHRRPEEMTLTSIALRFSVAGYALALLTSLLVLWLFGRTDDTSLAFVLSEVVVLGFPAAVGAAAARLIL